MVFFQRTPPVRYRIRESGSGEAVVWEHAGDILFHLNKTDKAVEAWRKALELADPTRDIILLQRKIESGRWIE